ncbi:FAD-dependent monooxygenase [Fodinicola acaciae]|uniref:FAD-dependent monooxygenase n=1 Tax=Fodinicola acaciae TaxID=2681555 RepID=UPI0013CF54F2|nr:FAD-dependent monooxygenase [Fodinicola acaciae]
MSRSVLISGASIAGPALAYWLNRHGFRVTVVERAAELRSGGYKIDLRGVTVEVAERMGIMDRVRELSTDMRDETFVDRDDRPLLTMPADFFAGRHGHDDEIMRGDLSQILYDLTKDDVDYIFDDSITELVDDADGVKVSFEKSPARRFDLVVGADGLHSNVRKLAFGPEPDFVHEMGYYAAICGTPNHLGLDRSERLYVEPGRTTNVYSTSRMAGAKALFLFSSEKLTYDHRDVATQKKIVADTFAGVGWRVPQLLESMWTAPDFYFDSLSQVRMDSWSRGRVVLLGDAGYCPSLASGQGTGLALVGAYVLAGELAAAGGDHVAGFAGYEREMRPYVEKNQKLGSQAVKQMVARSNAAIRMQLLMLRVMPKLPGSAAIMRKVMQPIHDAANGITLKDY